MGQKANSSLSFTIPAGKRFVIELVSAEVRVPAGEWARLRMFTTLGTSPSNIDLALTRQGVANGQSVYVATHAVRAYAETLGFNINRDNASTSGHALVCVSGYLVDS